RQVLNGQRYLEPGDTDLARRQGHEIHITNTPQRPVGANRREDVDPARPLPAPHGPVVDLSAAVLPDDVGRAIAVPIANAPQRPVGADRREDVDPARSLPTQHGPVVDLSAAVLPD